MAKMDFHDNNPVNIYAEVKIDHPNFAAHKQLIFKQTCQFPIKSDYEIEYDHSANCIVTFSDENP